MVLWAGFFPYRRGSAREEAYFLWTIGMKVVFSCVFSPYRKGSAREKAYYLWTIGMKVVLWAGFFPYRMEAAREEAYYLWTIGMKMVLWGRFSPYRVGPAREEAYFPRTIGTEMVLWVRFSPYRWGAAGWRIRRNIGGILFCGQNIGGFRRILCKFALKMNMTLFLILMGIVALLCVWLNHVSSRIGVPALLAFIVLGIVFGNNGLFPIQFDDRDFAQQTCTVALIFIMFYGGFGTRWETARTVAVESGLLATVGVALTAGLVGAFCHYALSWSWNEGLLLGAVVSSTDAASVFSILRGRKLGLKAGTAPLLEVESGSNDPCAYMLTAVMLEVCGGTASAGRVVWMLVAQLAFGALLGWAIGRGAVFVMSRMKHQSSAYASLLVLGIAILSYSVPDLAGGNGYLSAYLAGIILGNEDFKFKKDLVAFFDGLTGFMQVIIFFMLGLLARPAMLHKAILPAFAIFLFMLVIARPASVNAVLTFFRKGGRYNLKQQTLISFVGLRGAASIVFAIMAIGGLDSAPEHDIFNIVFCLVLLSISIQGTLIPFVAGKLDMVDGNEDVMKTFNDFQDNTNAQFSRVDLTEDSLWNGKRIKELGLPRNMLIVMVIRQGKRFTPKGNTRLEAGDRVVLITKSFEDRGNYLEEHTIKENGRWHGKSIREYDRPDRGVIVMVRRAGSNIIPNGDTVLEAGDVIVLCRTDNQMEQ